MTSVTNIKSSQALRGQAVRVVLAASEISVLATLYVGQIVQLSSSESLGAIISIDQFGRSFLVSPIQPNFNLESANTPGYLNAGEIIYLDGLENLLLQEDGYALLQEDGYAILLEN
jgi:hypothetical protein